MRDDWDDLRFVLAVADEGSVSGAARRLGVNHATVLRRVAAYEAATGVAIFDKTARGYAVPDARKRIIDAAREVERAVQSVGRLIQGARAPLTGEIRITSTDSLCCHVLPAALAGLRRDAPELKIELLCTNAHLDLGRIHADIAVRPALRLPADLTGEKAVDLGFGLFRAKGYAGEDWIGLAGPLAHTVASTWFDANVAPQRVVATADSFLVIREFAAARQGLAILPEFLGVEDGRLEAVPDVLPALSAPVWVASHSDLADVPRFAEARRALVKALSEMRPRLAAAGQGRA
ncbi:MAG: LysR family transcriptional regulator [Paracoccaceae bacterium]